VLASIQCILVVSHLIVVIHVPQILLSDDRYHMSSAIIVRNARRFRHRNGNVDAREGVGWYIGAVS
jgi:hypothetical protein